MLHKRKRRLSGGSEKMELLVKLIVGFLMLIVYFIFISLYYANYLSDVVGYSNFYNYTAIEENNYLLTYNILREYLYNNNTTVFDKPVKTVIEDTISNYYIFMRNSINVLVN
jgi:hypothetical protein